MSKEEEICWTSVRIYCIPVAEADEVQSKLCRRTKHVHQIE